MFYIMMMLRKGVAIPLLPHIRLHGLNRDTLSLHSLTRTHTHTHIFICVHKGRGDSMKEQLFMKLYMIQQFLSLSLSLSLFYGSTALYGPGPPRFVEVSWSHTLDTPQSVGLLWTSDQPVAETSTWQHTTLTTDRHPWPRWDSNPRS
jgi:hypothetical protein